MSFSDAVKRPFQDIKKLIIGIIIMIIPIVNIFGMGYVLQCAKSALRKSNKMPEWTEWVDLFVKGLIVLVIGLIYMIPVAIVLALTVGTAVLTGGFSALLSGGGIAALNTLASLGMGLIITLVVLIVMSLISSAAIIRYAERAKFGAAFEFSAIFKKAFTGTFIAAWIVSMIYAFVVMAVLSFIPVVGSGIGMFIAMVTMYTYLAEAYRKG